jgi:xylitol oxidase
MASLGHISVAGTVATGTHGSGDRNPTLSASVAALELVTADGDIVIVDDDNPDLPRAGAIVSLGCIGVVVRVALRIEPQFSIRQYVTDDISLDRIQEEFDDVFSSAYSVSYFTTWDARRTGQVWMKRREGQDPAWSEAEWMGGRPAPVKRHPLPGHDAVHCTEQGGERGPWHERLPHFKLEFTPSSGDELQTEYLVPRAHAVAALEEVSAIAGRIAPLLQVSEVRTMAADDLWLSGAFGRETVGIHFTWRKTPEVLAILPTLDTLFAAHSGRPHWGKLFELTSPLASRYPHFSDFIQLMSAVDPSSKFRNRLVDAVFGN